VRHSPEMTASPRSAEAVSGVVKTSGPPVLPCGAKDSAGRPRRESGESVPGTHEVWVQQIVWVADIDRTHRASSTPDGRKACWCERALARKISVAPTDVAARMDRRRNGARVQDYPNRFPVHGLRVTSLQVHETMKGVPGLLPVLLSPAGRRRVLWLAGQFRFTVPRGVMLTESTSGGSDSDSGVPAGDEGNVRGRHGSVKALQGPRRSAESSHPRR